MRGIDLVIQAFRKNKAYRGGNIWTNGETIYSYQMPIATSRDNEMIIVPSPGPSVTTSRHINILLKEWPKAIREEI